MENEEIMMNETTEAMTDVEEPITETETNEEESSSFMPAALLIAGGVAAIYGGVTFAKKHVIPHVVNGVAGLKAKFGHSKGKAVEAEAEEVQEDESEE